MRGRRYLQPGERPQTSPQSMHALTALDPRSGSPMNIDSFLQTVLDMKTNMHKRSAPPAGVGSPRRQNTERPRRDAFHESVKEHRAKPRVDTKSTIHAPIYMK